MRGSRTMPDETRHRLAPYDVIVYRQLRTEAGCIDAKRCYGCLYVNEMEIKITLPGMHEFITAVGDWAERWINWGGRGILQLSVSLKGSCDMPWC